MEGLIPFVEQMTAKYSKEELIGHVRALFGCREIFASVYQTFVNRGEMGRIEDLSIDEKTRIYQMTTGTKVERIAESKAIYLIEKLYA